MTTDQITPAQQAAIDRFRAAENLERARQIYRENDRYGIPLTTRDMQAVQAAELAYDRATLGWAVIGR